MVGGVGFMQKRNDAIFDASKLAEAGARRSKKVCPQVDISLRLSILIFLNTFVLDMTCYVGQ